MNNEQLLKCYRNALKMESMYIDSDIQAFIDWSTFRSLIEEELHVRMGTIWSTRELSREYAVAFESLPIPYQNDDCLEFGLNRNHQLFARPKPDQVAVLGNWESTFSYEKKSWSGVN